MKLEKICFFAGIFILVLFYPSLSEAQVTEEWSRIYNHIGSQDVSNGIALDNSGNVFVTGSVNNSPSTGTDYGTLKYSPAGTQQWFKRFNGSLDWLDYADDIIADNAGNVYVTGRTDAISGNATCVTIKYNSAGDSLWVRRYVNAYCSRILADNSGNVYVAGRRGDASACDYFVIKYNSAGDSLWSGTYSGTGSYPDEATCLAVDNAGNVYISGFVYSSTPGPHTAIVTIKYSPAGTQQWAAVFDRAATGSHKANDIAVDSSGNVYIGGYSDTASLGRTYLVVKYSSSGTPLWQARYSTGTPSTTIEAVSIALYQNSFLYVTGYGVFAATYYDYVTIKYNSSGVQQWVTPYHNGTDVAVKLVLDAAGNAYVTGSSSSASNGEDILTVKYNPAGAQQWIARWDGALHSNDQGRDIAVDGSGNVYVTGRALSSVNNDDYVTIKYSQPPSGIIQVSGEIPAEFSLGQNYPNPFNPMTNVKIQLPGSGLVSLKVFDITGKEVAEPVNEVLDAGTYNVNFDGSFLSSGTYFYRMEYGNFSQTKRMILIK
jgi:uncharacterized delta-60 repeat protein